MKSPDYIPHRKSVWTSRSLTRSGRERSSRTESGSGQAGFHRTGQVGKGEREAKAARPEPRERRNEFDFF